MKERKLTLTNEGILVQTIKADIKYHKRYTLIEYMLVDQNLLRISKYKATGKIVTHHITEFKNSSVVHRYQSENVAQIVQEADYRIKYIYNSRTTVDEPIDEKGQTELIIAVNQNQISVVRELLSDDRNVNAQDNQGWTALHVAADKNYNDIVALLLRVCL